MSKPFLVQSMVAVFLLAGVAWLWFQSAGSEAPPPEPPAAVDASAGANVSGAAAIDGAATVEVAEFAGDESEGAEPVERSEVEIDVEVAPTLRVQVWDRKRGVAAAEADVFVLSGLRAPEYSDRFAPHWCELAIERGRKFKATTAGLVELPTPSERTVIAARLPGASGMTIVREGQGGEVSVTLQIEETVTVKVVDQKGRPVANVPVGVQQRVAERVDQKRVWAEWKQIEQREGAVREYLAKAAANEPAENRARAMRQLRDLGRRRQDLRQTVRLLERATKGEKKVAAKKGLAKGSASRGKKGKKGKKKPKSKAVKSDPVVTTRLEVKSRRRTDEQGFAVFRHFQLYRHRTAKWWPKQHLDRFEAVLMVPVAEPVRQAFRGKPVPEDVVELRMPATGSVALRTVDRSGRPYTHPVHGELRIVDGKNPKWSRMPIRKLQDESQIVFPFVGLGVQLQSHCRLDDDDFRWRSPQFAGPQRAGEQVVVDLVVAPDVPMLCGRLLASDGVPLASDKVTFLINSMRGRLEGEEVLLDRDGRFHLPYQINRGHQAPFRLQVRHREQFPVPGLATTLAVLPTAGVTDVGDLQIDALPQIAFGRVVNDLGEPIADARVQLQRERQVGGRRPRLSWQDEAFTEVRTDEGGNFQLFGDVESARYRLRVTADQHFDYEQPNLPGRDGIVIELPRRSRLVGTVLLPDWMPSKRIRSRLQPQAVGGKARDGRVVSANNKKYVYFDNVRPGLYGLTLRIEEFPDAFLRVDGLQVAAGQMGVHPRLEDLDLRNSLFRFEVIGIDEAGKRVSSKTPLLARVMRPSGKQELLGFPWRNGRAVVFSAEASIEVVPVAPGYRAARTFLSPGRSEIRFLRIPPVELRAVGLRQLVGDESVWISLEAAGNEAVAQFDSRSRRLARSMSRQSASHGRLDSNDVARLTPVRDGRYRVVARLGDKRRGGLVSVPLGEVDVRVQPGRPALVLAVPVDAAAVQRAMADVVARRAAAEPRGK